jgi:hypothetical protein
MKYYNKKDNHRGNEEEEEEEEEDDGEEAEYEIDDAAETELKDATIKLVRLLANISIDSTIGMEIGTKYDNLFTLYELLSICDDSMEQEEMLLNVVAALTNLTYYSCQVSCSPSGSVFLLPLCFRLVYCFE